jgi:hypothetical protein
MKPVKKMNRTAREMAFAKELWKLILEAEDLVRNHYMKLAKREIYDLYDGEEEENPRHFCTNPLKPPGGRRLALHPPGGFMVISSRIIWKH